MKYTIILLLVAYGLLEDKKSACPLYVCEKKFISNKGCASTKFKNDFLEIHLHSCGKNKICDILLMQDGVAKCMDYYNITKRYPGEYCTSSHECYSGKCQDSKCIWQSPNDKCTDDIDCNVGLFCLNGLCKNYITQKEDCRKSSLKCPPNAVCDSNYPNCIKIGSLDIGSKSNTTAACSSFYIYNGTCASGPILDPRYKGQNPGKCEYLPRNYSFSEKPLCGMSSNQASYCNYGPGDFNIQSVSFL